MKNEIIAKSKRLLSTTSLKLKKASPEILLVTGIAGTIVGTVLACKATTKVSEIIEEKNKMIEDVHTCLEDKDVEYTEEDSKKDLTIIYTQTGIKLLKLYGPAIGVMTLSIGSIIAGHRILSKRNAAIAAAYGIVDNSFKKYRKNVVERFGEEVDKELKYSIKSKEVKSKKNGKTVKETEKYIEPTDGIPPLEGVSEYSRFFDAASTNFAKDPEYNMMFLRRQQDYANEVLKSRGHLFLNEVYDMLDIPRSKAGQVVGWIYDEKNPKGDNYVDFNIYRNTEGNRRFVNGLEYNILLDFNVDGVIYDLI